MFIEHKIMRKGEAGEELVNDCSFLPNSCPSIRGVMLVLCVVAFVGFLKLLAHPSPPNPLPASGGGRLSSLLLNLNPKTIVRGEEEEEE